MGKKNYVDKYKTEEIVVEEKVDVSQLKHLIRDLEGTSSGIFMLGRKEQILKYLKEMI